MAEFVADTAASELTLVIPDWVLQAVREDTRTANVSGEVASAAGQVGMARCSAAEAEGTAMVAAFDAPLPLPQPQPMRPAKLPR